MSEQSKKFREAMKSKAHRMANGESGAVDASGWKPEGSVEPLNTEYKTGPRPISKRAFKRGGHVKGDEVIHHAGRARRKDGGVTVEKIINRNVKDANDDREGEKHIGAMNKGGRAHKMGGGPLGGASAITDPVVANAVAGAMQNRAGVQPNRMNFGAPGRSPMGVKTGGKVDHPHRKEDLECAEKLVRDHRKDGGGNWIEGAIKHPGALHKELHVPEGKKIPEKKLEKAAHAGGKEGKRARLAETLKGLHRADGGSAVATGKLEGTRPTGGREAHAHGGRAGKGKMNVNIIIGAHAQPQQQPAAPPPPGPIAPHPMVPPPPPAGMPMGGAPMGGMPPGAGPVPMPPPGMPRKDGGSVKMHWGAGGGKGRLEKINKYGLPPAK